MNIKKYNLKAISPVVATALLIVVAVVSVVGFQTWFGTFSSGVFSNTETKSENSVGNTQIDTVIGSSVYFENSGTENITVTQVKVDGVDCNITTNMTSGISELDVSSCLANVTTQTPEVVIYTNEGIYSEKFYMETAVTAVASNSTPSVFSGVMGWNRTYDDSNPAWANGIAVDGEENVYVTGWNNVFNINYFTIKYNGTDGSEIWNLTYDAGGSAYPNGIDTDINNDIYVTGYINNGSTNDFYTIKYDGNTGNEIWNVSYDGGFSDEAEDVYVDDNLNVYVTGNSNDGSTNNFYTIKYNGTNGNELWNVSYDGGVLEQARGVGVDSSGNVYVIGFTYDGLDQDLFLIKYTSSAVHVWNRTIEVGLGDEGRSVIIDSSENIYITGIVADNMFTLKYDSSGNELWNRSYDYEGNFEQGNDIAIDGDGSVYVTGIANNGLNDYFTIKYDSSGNYLWNATYDSGGSEEANSIAVGASGSIYITGMSENNYFTIKYS